MYVSNNLTYDVVRGVLLLILGREGEPILTQYLIGVFSQKFDGS